jgi:DMSO/TMAO reductase YedYZ molybdopterin-dependent catalytic subunit
VIAIGGRVLHPQSLTLQDLQKLPSTHVQVSFATGHGTESGDYTGALLRTVLDNASPIDDPGKNARLRHTFLVSGRDGYAVALSQGEIDPDFEGKSVLLAYAKDGKPFDPVDGIRLIVPNDKHAGRAVRDVVAVEVR